MLVLIIILSLTIGIKILSLALTAVHARFGPRVLLFLEDLFVPVDAKQLDALGVNPNQKAAQAQDYGLGLDNVGAQKTAWQAPGGHDPKANMYFWNW